MRQGYGEMKQGDNLYKGQWMNNMKHGQGELYVGENEVMIGTWNNG